MKTELILKHASLYYGSSECDIKYKFQKDMAASDEVVTVAIDLSSIKAVEELAKRVLVKLKEASGGHTMKAASIAFNPTGSVTIFGSGYHVRFSTPAYSQRQREIMQLAKTDIDAAIRLNQETDSATKEFGISPRLIAA